MKSETPTKWELQNKIGGLEKTIEWQSLTITALQENDRALRHHIHLLGMQIKTMQDVLDLWTARLSA